MRAWQGREAPSGSSRRTVVHSRSAKRESTTQQQYLRVGAINMTTPELRARLGSLPQEIYDDIYNLTFTAESGARIISYKLADCSVVMRPTHRMDESKRFCGRDSISLFLVDRASHTRFAKSYYGDMGAFFVFMDCRKMSEWFRSLQPKHRNMLRSLKCVVFESFARCHCGTVVRGRCDVEILLAKIVFGSEKEVSTFAAPVSSLISVDFHYRYLEIWRSFGASIWMIGKAEERGCLVVALVDDT